MYVILYWSDKIARHPGKHFHCKPPDIGT